MMLSVRMRASKKGAHISGAEGLYLEKDSYLVQKEYIIRALTHKRGMPDSITVTIEKLDETHDKISALDIRTVKCKSPQDAHAEAGRILTELGISDKAVKNAFSLLASYNAMRGASLMDAKTGMRLEPDKVRGVRASKMGISKKINEILRKTFFARGLDADTVIEALVLASKAASCKCIIAEVCISDDPHYTTGYVASNETGYVRLTNIKQAGSSSGGRVFFIGRGADVQYIIRCLQNTPVMISKAGRFFHDG